MEYEKKFDRGIRVTKQNYASNLKEMPAQDSNIEKLKKIGKEGLEFYKNFDFFGKPVTLKYSNKDTFKSLMGATISLSILGVMLSYLIYSLLLFLKRSNPTYSSILNKNVFPDPLYLAKFDSIETRVALNMLNEYQNQSLNDLLEFDVQYIQKRGFISKVVENLTNFIKCNKIPEFQDKLISNSSFYDQFQLKNGLCFDILNFNKNNSFLSGTSMTADEDYIRINIFIKDDAQQNINITKYSMIESGAFHFIFVHNVFNTTSTIANPLINSTTDFSYSISASLTKNKIFYIHNDTLLDYFDIKKPDPIPRYIFSYGEVDSEYDFFDNYPNNTAKSPAISISLKVSQNTNIFTRKYTTLKEFFVDVVGIMNGMWMGGMIFGQLMNAKLMKIDLINKGFYLIEEEKADEIKLNQTSNIKKIITNSEELEKSKMEKKELLTPANELPAEKNNLNNLLNENLDKAKENPEINKKNDILHKEIDNSNSIINNSNLRVENNSNSIINNSNLRVDSSILKNRMNKILKENEIFRLNSNIEFSSSKSEVNIESPTKNNLGIQKLNQNVIQTDNNKRVRLSEVINRNDYINSPNITSYIQETSSGMNQKGNILNKFKNDDSLIIDPKKRKKFRKFKMSFKELLFIMMPCCNSPQLIQKKKIFEECGQIVENFFDIERIISLLREYQELRNVVLSSDEYKILKYLTTPKIEIIEDNVNINKFEKYSSSDDEIKKNYSHFVESMNKLLKKQFITLIENNLIELHKLSSKGILEEENDEE